MSNAHSTISIKIMVINISSYFKLNALPSSAWLEQTEHLLIGHPEPSDIFFFYKPLLDLNLGGKSAFYRISSNNPQKEQRRVSNRKTKSHKLPSRKTESSEIKAILLRFFIDYREIDILVVSQEIVGPVPITKDALNQHYESLYNHAINLFTLPKEDITYLRRYSCWINATFPQEQLDDFAEVFLSDRTLRPIEDALVCAERGFLFQITAAYHYALYERYILMYGLLLAYQISLEIFINELAFLTIENIGSLEQLRKECAEFNAIFYFTNPVKPGNSNLRPSWNKLMRPFNMDTLTAEMMGQLEAITQIYRIEQERNHRARERIEEQERLQRELEAKEHERAKQKRQERFNFWLSVVGILLTALTVIEIKPSDLMQFLQEWGQLFTNLLQNLG
ncbi:hypothetical protein TI05_11055 [Achromatium sp. WMS3]|nr:hypothetical protein TI05_11055 [Achromatium sp. WMS3]